MDNAELQELLDSYDRAEQEPVEEEVDAGREALEVHNRNLRERLAEREAEALRVEETAREEKELEAITNRVVESSSLSAKEIRALALSHYAEDADFRDAWESGDSVRWEMAREAFIDSLAESHPKDSNGMRALSAAVAASRSVDVDMSGGSSRFDSIEWGKLSDAEFRMKRQEVFEAAKHGELRSSHSTHTGGKYA